jgi:hypothetical protein
MKYEAPEVTTLTTAINAIQQTDPIWKNGGPLDSFTRDVPTPAYADWEE